jgi:hypothetical protein
MASRVPAWRGLGRFQRRQLGRPVLANVDREKFSIYQNKKTGTFRDQAVTTGIGQATLLLVAGG